MVGERPPERHYLKLLLDLFLEPVDIPFVAPLQQSVLGLGGFERIGHALGGERDFLFDLLDPA